MIINTLLKATQSRLLRQYRDDVINIGAAYGALFSVPVRLGKSLHAITAEDQVVAGSGDHVARFHHAHCALVVLRHIVSVELLVRGKPLQSIQFLLDVAC